MRERRTIYQHNGYKLRSYTELMWARLMDAVDIFYLYEPHLIQVDGCKYLPDFYLPESDMYLEVKGTYPTDEEKAKAAQVLERTGRPVVFLVARPQADIGGVKNCCLLLPCNGDWINGSLHTLDQMYQAAVGKAAWARALLSVQEDDIDYVRRAGDVLDEVLQKMVGRSEAESHLRLHHLRVNEDRMALEHTQSIAEKAIKFWRDRYYPKSGPEPRQLKAGSASQ
ncbi:hypothetical protein [Metapseudomonas otitidis]|uniref:hypothetical protein n=1 Tax=Metapseudomonas otitidis TaxID=319939 RepID=UPI0024486C55|nr:hypothetical protein [Pseudomonas otitidis]MDG9785235.1 hypothetical protein [Pseudomonas otitidis]